jgi:hypothetical protein
MICWNFGRPQKPELIVPMAKKIETSDIRHSFKVVDDRTFYWGQKSGVVSFFVHNPKNETGGLDVTLNVIAHGKRKLRGLWSGNCVDMYRAGFPESMPCFFNVNGEISPGKITVDFGRALIINESDRLMIKDSQLVFEGMDADQTKEEARRLLGLPVDVVDLAFQVRSLSASYSEEQ